MNRAAAGTGADAALRVLTFEAGGHLFAVRAEEVGMVVASTEALPPGTRVVDIVGLLASAGRRSDRGCVVLLRPRGGAGAAVAVTAARAREVVGLESEKLLPLPAFLFRGGNPFLGMVTGEAGATFLLAEPERLLAAAASP